MTMLLDMEDVFFADEVTRKVTLLDVPLPNNTAEARGGRVWGTIVVGVVCGAEGSVLRAEAVVGLPCGLSERAAAAAQRIDHERRNLTSSLNCNNDC